MKLTYFGHSCFMLEKGTDKILIDPFLSGNPFFTGSLSDIQPTLILVTHGHGDHLGDAISISNKNSIPIIATFELANYCESKGATTIGAHIGGKVLFDFGWVKLVNAVHSSSSPDGLFTGVPCGFVVNFHGNKIYHAGDTAIFSDMLIIGDLYTPDIALLPIGGHYTMDIEEAVKAVEFLKPKKVIPMHYNTFPPIKNDPELFKKEVEQKYPGITVEILKPMKCLEFEKITK